MTYEEFIALYRATDSVPQIPALDGLDRIDWGAMKHAYGSAADIPALFRALLSGDPVHRDLALEGLVQTIRHEGNIFPATLHVIPILYNLLEADGPHDKAKVACLLAMIADGEPSFTFCEGDPAAADEWRAILKNVGRSLDIEVAEGRSLMTEIRELLSACLDLLCPYLRDPEPAVRQSVAVAFGRFPEIGRRCLPDLKAALADETDDYARDALQGVVEHLTTASL